MRSYVYSPNMDKDIENIVNSCKGYALTSKSPQSNIVLDLKRTDHSPEYIYTLPVR